MMEMVSEEALRRLGEQAIRLGEKALADRGQYRDALEKIADSVPDASADTLRRIALNALGRPG